MSKTEEIDFKEAFEVIILETKEEFTGQTEDYPFFYSSYGGDTIQDDVFFYSMLKAGGKMGYKRILNNRVKNTQYTTDFHILSGDTVNELWTVPPKNFIVITGDHCGCCGGNGLTIERLTTKELRKKHGEREDVKELLEYWSI